jgi:multidrug efflux system outer membrane protein
MKKSNLIKGSLLIMMALTLHACFVSKPYQKPKIETEDLFRKQTNVDSFSMAMLTWNELFTDPILQQHIQEAIAQNLDLKMAMQNIAMAEANLKQSKANYLPSINAVATQTHQELSRNSQFGRIFSGSINQYELSTRVVWEADIWGKISSMKKAALADYMASENARQAVQTEIVANVASLYFQLLALDAQTQMANKTLENRLASLEVIKALKQAGNVTEVAVQQTEAQLYTVQLVLEDLQYQVQVFENSFQLLLGKSGGTVARSSFDNQKMEAPIKTGIPTLLLSLRPDVKAAELNFRNAFEMTNVAKSFFYPSFTINATTGLQSLELEQWFSTRSLFANIITGLAQPIFNQRQNKTRLEVAKANQEQAYLNFQKSILVAGNEVSNSLASFENETKKLTIRKQQVESLNRAANYSDELLQYGMVNYLEVLVAKDQTLNAEIAYIDTQFQQWNAMIQLYKALGGGY